MDKPHDNRDADMSTQEAAAPAVADRPLCPHSIWTGLPGTDPYHPHCHWTKLCAARGCFWRKGDQLGKAAAAQRGFEL